MDSVYQLVRTWNPAIVEAEKPVPEAWAAGPPKEKLMKGYTNNVAPSHEYEEPKEALETARLEGLATLASGRTPDAINRTMVLAREALGMDVAFVSRFAEDRMEFRALEGDAESFG
jgi:hypothetical protein